MSYSLLDILIVSVYVIVFFFIAKYVEQKKKIDNPEYRFYTYGLMAKIFGGIALCVIYTFYYQGGDTTLYFQSSKAMVNMFFKDSGNYFSILFGNLSAENYSIFDSKTGWPYYYHDAQTFAVIRFVSPFTLLGFKSFLATTVLVAAFNYSGIWRLYRLFVERFPNMNARLAIAILFMPSLIFWGSGILKDSFTISAAGWLVYSFYRLFVNKKRPLFYIFALLLSSYVLIAIKPYIFFSLIIGLVIWFTAEFVNKIKGTFLKAVISPVLILLIWAIGSGLVLYLGTLIGGAYSDLDSLITKAVVTQEDLKKEYYMGNSFDIGDIEPSLTGIISKYPQAVTAGLFRPFIWESNNPVMVLAGLENMVLLFLVFYLLITVNPFKIIRITFSESLLLSSLVFTITFAFSIGLSTSNFGSLVRYKIPLIPFFVSYLLVVIKIGREKKTSLE